MRGRTVGTRRPWFTDWYGTAPMTLTQQIRSTGGVASAGEIRFDSVHAEGERELAAVVQIVFEHVPDDPGARQVDDLAVPIVLERLLHVGGTPAGNALRHELPGTVEALNELGGCSR